MSKPKNTLKKIGIVILVIGIAWMICSFIPPKQAVSGVNPWRKTEQTLISAHRGGAILNPENTKKAFDYVIVETGYTDIVEIDVRVTKDNKLVIIHDDSINRTGIAGHDMYEEIPEEVVVFINERTYEELLQYNLGVNFTKDGAKPYANLSAEEAASEGLTIMLFDDFLRIYEKYDVKVLLEIKDKKELGVHAVDLAESIIAKYPSWDERIMTISFSTDVVNHSLKTYPNRYVAGMGYNMVSFLAGSLLNIDCLFDIKYQSVQSSMITEAGPLKINCATQAFVDSAHARNQCVAYWTINEEADMRYLIGLGVDAITTNSPDLLATVLGKDLTQPRKTLK